MIKWIIISFVIIFSFANTQTIELSGIFFDVWPCSQSNCGVQIDTATEPVCVTNPSLWECATDFEGSVASNSDAQTVDTFLSDKKTPVLQNAPHLTINNTQQFGYWFQRNSNFNIPFPGNISLSANNNLVFTYENRNFFPLDGRGFGNQFNSHNYAFTFSYHGQFVYTGVELFNFSGDLDFFLFINNRVAIDVVGVGTTQNVSIDLTWPIGGCPKSSYPAIPCSANNATDPCACLLNLNKSAILDIDLFLAQRRTPYSSISIATTIDFKCPYYDWCGVCQGDGQSCCNCTSLDPCNPSECDVFKGECNSKPVTCAQPKNKCEESVCQNGTCITQSVECLMPKNYCVTVSCDPLYGCVSESTLCDDQNSCTDDSCEPSLGCIYTPRDCDDNNVCTTDVCVAGHCVHYNVQCNMTDRCITATCHPEFGCQYANALCETDNCFIGGCNSVYGCYKIPKNCDDGNACTIDTCNLQSGCVHSVIDCDDSNLCTNDSCNPSFGCLHEQIHCGNSDACTTYSCQPATGICQNTTTICDDLNPCTTDYCGGTSGCGHYPIVCDDNSTCTTDSCDPQRGCKYTPVVSTDGCIETVCQGNRLLTFPKNCSDGLKCTLDLCTDGICSNPTANCESCTLCYDLSPCIIATCVNGTCEHIPNPICDDHDPCTADICTPIGPSASCSHVPKCTSSDACFPVHCNPLNGTCFNTSVICDDQNDCTTDACDGGSCTFLSIVCPSDGCNASYCMGGQCVANLYNCDDGNACTEDYCVFVPGNKPSCVHDILSCFSSPCNPQICHPDFGCMDAPINCDDSNPCTTDLCDQGVCVHQPRATLSDPCGYNYCDPYTGKTQQVFHCDVTLDSCVINSVCTVVSQQLVCTFYIKDCPSNNSCNPLECQGGECVATNSINCDDSDPCTSDTCLSGVCFSAPETCDDNNLCTSDACDPILGCRHYAVSCNDFNLCTVDSCSKSSGCQNKLKNCEDGNACTYDTCSILSGECVHSNVTCNDGNLCTTDTCDTKRGCLFENIKMSSTDKCWIPHCDKLRGILYSPLSCPTGCACDSRQGCICSDSSRYTVILTEAINVTINATKSVVKISFPVAPSVNVTFGVATPTIDGYRDPIIDPPGEYQGTSFFLDFYENSVLTHIPPNGTFLEIYVENPEKALLYYYDSNQWIRNCLDPVVIDNALHIRLCHATQYAIFNLKVDIPAETFNLTAAIVVPILVGVIGALTGFVVYNRWRLKKAKRSTVNDVEMVPTISTVKDIKVQHRLGGGNFGDVYKGEWKGTTVALKKLRSASSYDEFVKESVTLSKLSHPNIVQFMGIYVDEENNKFIVTEFMKNGDLLSLLRTVQTLEMSTLTDMAKQAAAGMVYLSGENIVHRDLAVRNILVASSQERKYIIKVSDFGLSRTIGENNYYVKEDSQLPVKWSAPESLKFGRFSSRSDVWSFGICLWEIFSKGEIPYSTMSNAETMEKVVEGYRLPQPPECDDRVYKLMLWCWKQEPSERPSFDQILAELEKILQQMTPLEIQQIPDEPIDGNMYTITKHQ